MRRIDGTDLSVFPLCLGGNVFGWTVNEHDGCAVLDRFAAAGGNFIDTADVYSAWVPGHAGGESETIRQLSRPLPVRAPWNSLPSCCPRRPSR